MTTFDLHILRRLLAGFVLLVGLLVVFFVVLHYVEYIDDFMDRGATMREVFATYYPSYVPEIVRLTSPLALFLACVYLTGKLAQELQLVAVQTSGVSLLRLMRPFVLVGVLVTGVVFWFNGWVVPVTNGTVLEFERRYLKDAPQRLDVNDIHRQNRPGSILSVGYFDAVTNMAHRVSLSQFDDARTLTARIDAPRMQWVDSTGAWRMIAPVRRAFVDGEERRFELARLDTVLTIRPRDLARTERDVETMDMATAAGYVEQLRRSGAGGLGRTLVAYHSRFAYPFANLILVFIAVPLAAQRRRGGQAVRIGLGLGITFVYLALQKLAEPFGYAGTLSPAVAAWLPHAVFALVALAFVWRARR